MRLASPTRTSQRLRGFWEQSGWNSSSRSGNNRRTLPMAIFYFGDESVSEHFVPFHLENSDLGTPPHFLASLALCFNSNNGSSPEIDGAWARDCRPAETARV